ncbi:MAG: hypothetical protein AMJ75_05785 [Phycisphaerae bacterium SM1_79]|nr:MAG: hypothetical protein AMJ75_05785 [Phycisphaerae bacterium SM1_79]
MFPVDEQMWMVTFSLNKPSPSEAYSEIDGMKVEVKENRGEVVVGFIQATDVDEARRKALLAANEFLSALSWRFGAHLAIKGQPPNVERIDPSGKKQIFLETQEGVAIGEKMIGVKKDASGYIVNVLDSQRLGKIDVKHSDAADFYRRAHLTDHPFEKFGNLYKVAENIADKIRIVKGHSRYSLEQAYGRRSYEMEVLQLALDECFGGNSSSLAGAAKGLLSSSDIQQPIPRIVEILYKANRCQIMHAKASGGKKVPFNPQDEKDVTAALPLMDFVAKSLLEYEQTLL